MKRTSSGLNTCLERSSGSIKRKVKAMRLDALLVASRVVTR